MVGGAAINITESHEDPSRFSLEDDKDLLLGLPHGPSFQWATLRLWNRVYVLDAKSFRVIAKRTVKSTILIWKVGFEPRIATVTLD